VEDRRIGDAGHPAPRRKSDAFSHEKTSPDTDQQLATVKLK